MFSKRPLDLIHFPDEFDAVLSDCSTTPIRDPDYKVYFAMIKEPVLYALDNLRSKSETFEDFVTYQDNFSRFSALSRKTFNYLRNRHPDIVLDIQKIYLAPDDIIHATYPQLGEYKIRLRNKGESPVILDFTINAHCGLFLHSLDPKVRCYNRVH